VGWLEASILGEYQAVELFKSPFWVTFLSGQRIAIVDTVLRQVVILDLEKEEIRTLEDDSGRPYIFGMPMGIATSDVGEIFVVDSLIGSVLKFSADEKFIETYGGLSVLGHPVGIAVNDRTKLFYVSDAVEHNIAVFDLRGNLLYKIGERGAKDGQFNFPTDLDLDEEGNIYVIDTLNFRVQVLDESGRFLRKFGEQGTEPGSFRLPKGLAVSPHGQVYVSDILSHKIVVFDYQGRYLMSLGGKSFSLKDGGVSPGGFFGPRGIAADAAGRILVVDGMNKMIQRFQYLTEDYLKTHPILKEEVYLPPSMSRQLLTSPVVESEGAL
jgi:DNA-binding beta-propeller fold protein YncE